MQGILETGNDKAVSFFMEKNPTPYWYREGGFICYFSFTAIMR